MKKLFLISIGLVFYSCNQGVVFDEYKDFSKQAWNADDVLRFEYFIKDTKSNYTTLLKVRHTVDYEYQNLFLFVSNETQRDTVELFLADKKGEWFGKGIGEIREMEIVLSGKKQYKDKKKNTVVIEQAMRYGDKEKIKKLKNIDALGITVFVDDE